MFRNNLRHILNLSLSTLFSRVLGLLRDVLMMSALGAGIHSSAFLLAFAIPNLFRRLLGEGALSSAFTPVFSSLIEKKEVRTAWKTTNQTLSWLAVISGFIIASGISTLFLLEYFGFLNASWITASPYFQLLLPYTFLICAAAILTAALNALGHFLIPSFSPILLNLAMMGSIGLGWGVWRQEPAQLALTLCGGVIAGGILQLMLPAIQTVIKGWKPRLDFSPGPSLDEVRRLFLTATVGAAVIQINILVSRFLAYQVSDDAVSQLYLASRLTELPLGMFSVAIYTVLFPVLSRYSASGDRKSYAETFENGIILTLLITLPAMFGLAVLAQPIIGFLFVWGRFEASQVQAIAPLLIINALAIPAYSTVALTTRGFHSVKDMRQPVRVALWALGINTGLSLALMLPFGAIGLASANTLTACFQAIWLYLALHRTHLGISARPMLRAGIRILIFSAVMGALCLIASHLLLPQEASKLRLGSMIATIILLGMLSYALLVWYGGLRHAITRWFRRE